MKPTAQIMMEASRERKKRFLRLGAQLSGLIADLDKELQRMKERKVSEEFIAQKDAQVDHLVSFYNDVEAIVNEYDADCRFLRMSNALLEGLAAPADILTKSAEDILKNIKV